MRCYDNLTTQEIDIEPSGEAESLSLHLLSFAIHSSQTYTVRLSLKF